MIGFEDSSPFVSLLRGHVLVVSQWRVNSASTSQLMTNFYARMSRGAESRTKAEAMRTATLQLMKHTEHRHPFYWASFVLLGTN
jgi:CHAT domain-containing protein